MPKAKYRDIYEDLKQKIETQYQFGELLPPESELTKTYGVSRNTVRRALTMLAKDGYVQSVQGMGVRSIFQPSARMTFKIGEIESFREAARRNGQSAETKIIEFTEIIVDHDLSKLTGFEDGSVVFKITRVHYLDGIPLILNHNYFLKEVVGNLTIQIAISSIYDYLEKEKKINIVNAKRTIYIDYMTEEDNKYIEMGIYNCIVVVSSNTYSSDGKMFEYTESRHHPNYFCFQDNALRHP